MDDETQLAPDIRGLADLDVWLTSAEPQSTRLGDRPGGVGYWWRTTPRAAPSNVPNWARRWSASHLGTPRVLLLAWAVGLWQSYLRPRDGLPALLFTNLTEIPLRQLTSVVVVLLAR